MLRPGVALSIFIFIVLLFWNCLYYCEKQEEERKNSLLDQATAQSHVLALLSPKTASQCPARLCAEAEKQIYDINLNLRTYLVPMLHTLYFKYVKLDLSRPCPFWRSDPICARNDCSLDGKESVDSASGNSSGHSSGVLSSWKDGRGTLGAITFPSRQSTLFSAWRDNPLDFALLDNEAMTSN